MELIVIALAAASASLLTLFSGFGLGTLLTPVFALFFPVPVAIAATAIVHGANNLFKLGLLARDADWRVVARFGIPAALASLIGATLLGSLDQLPSLARYKLAGAMHDITPVKLAIGCLIAVFALLELSPRFNALAFPARWLPLGGLLSGFFGGLSGNQGALRSAFLIKAGMSKEAFVATGAVCAVIVDASRLAVYGSGVLGRHFATVDGLLPAVACGTLAAFAGAWLGKKLLAKVTLRTVQMIVALAMLAIGLALMAGLI